MADTPEILNLTNLRDESSVVQSINTNFNNLRDSILNLLSTTVAGNNAMNVSLDMNGQQIINLPQGFSNRSAARLQDIVDAIATLPSTFKGDKGPKGDTGAPGSSDFYLCRFYGFIGDGQSHPLSSVYPTLEAARAVYPRATALSNEIDGLALQKTIDQQASTGRAILNIPACDARLTNELDFTGVAGKISGAGPLVSILRDVREGAKTTLRQGDEAVAQGQPLIVEDVYFINTATNTNGSTGFFIRHNQNAGILQALCFRNVIWHKYQINDLYNVGRGLDFNNVVVFGPDFQKQNNGGIRVRGTAGNTYGMFSHRYYNCLIANYRWGWDYQISNCAVEGQSFVSCAAYNGDGMVNVNCNGVDASGNTGYKSLLWSFDNCDWEGISYALQMKNCRNVKVSAGFYIFSRPYNTATDVIYKPDNTAVATGTGRSMFNFIGCSGFSLQDVEMASIDMKDSILVDVDENCDTGKFEDSVVRAFGNAAVVGFRLSGAIANTIIEKNTTWLSWPGGPKIFYVGTGDKARQISYTDVLASGGSVTDDGYYNIAGFKTVTSDSSGKATISFPSRANGQSFFAQAPLVSVTPENANVPIDSPSLSVRTVSGFTVFAPGATANLTFAINYVAYGRV